MTLYGLDFVKDQEGKFHLLEVNGVFSGMRGFKQLYGDDRIEDQVYEMLQQRYGKITVNDGTYARMQYKKEHPLKFIWYSLLEKLSFLQRKPTRSTILSFSTARTSWMDEKTSHEQNRIFPFEKYLGQESTIISNYITNNLPHPQVNPFITEAIAHNKFFTYQILKDSKIKEMIPKSTLLGFGFTHEQELEELLENHTHFVIKPILGSQGKGIEFIDQKTAQEHRGTRGPLETVRVLDSTFNLLYLEDIIAEENFTFEKGLGIIQPFIDSKRIINRQKAYSCIRAIVCNERFVDAYVRLSSGKKANLAQGAKAQACDEIEKEKIAALSEKVVAVFEEQCMEYEPETFKSELYGQYVASRGRTTDEMKEADTNKSLSFVLQYIALTHARYLKDIY